jgi:hypothetical protein
MKKKVFLTVIILSITAIIAVINVNLAKIDSLPISLSLNNIEAITDESTTGEKSISFVFNGTTWTNAKQWYNILGKNYTPILVACTSTKTSTKVTVGVSVSVGSIGFSASTSVGGTTSTTWKGKMIQCQRGNGNCRNGTSCIADPI